MLAEHTVATSSRATYQTSASGRPAPRRRRRDAVSAEARHQSELSLNRGNFLQQSTMAAPRIVPTQAFAAAVRGHEIASAAWQYEADRQLRNGAILRRA